MERPIRILTAIGLLTAGPVLAQSPKVDPPVTPPAGIQELPDPKSPPATGSVVLPPPPAGPLHMMLPPTGAPVGNVRFNPSFGYYPTQWRSYPSASPSFGIIGEPVGDISGQASKSPKPLPVVVAQNLPGSPVGLPGGKTLDKPVVIPPTDVAKRQTFVLPPPTIPGDVTGPILTTDAAPVTTQPIVVPPIVPSVGASPEAPILMPKSTSQADFVPAVPTSVLEIAGPKPSLARLGRPAPETKPTVPEIRPVVKPASYEVPASPGIMESVAPPAPLPVIHNGPRRKGS